MYKVSILVPDTVKFTSIINEIFDHGRVLTSDLCVCFSDMRSGKATPSCVHSD